jgi:hypothetical protein
MSAAATPFAGGIPNDQRQAVIRKRHEIIAVAAEGANLAAARAVVHRIAGPSETLHKTPLHIAGQHPVLANVNYHIVRRHFTTSTRMSVLGEKNRQAGPDFWSKNLFEGCRERRNGSDYP